MLEDCPSAEHYSPGGWDGCGDLLGGLVRTRQHAMATNSEGALRDSPADYGIGALYPGGVIRISGPSQPPKPPIW